MQDERDTRKNHFQTTDDFSFQSAEPGVIQLGFGPTSVQMTAYAAKDLVYRLASYLVFLEHGPGSFPFEEEQCPAEEPMNVISIFSQRKTIEDRMEAP